MLEYESFVLSAGGSCRVRSQHERHRSAARHPPGAASPGPARCPALTLIVRLDSTTLEQHLNIWCDACLLPSGYDCTYGVELHGVACGVVRISGCVSCDKET